MRFKEGEVRIGKKRKSAKRSRITHDTISQPDLVVRGECNRALISRDGLEGSR